VALYSWDELSRLKVEEPEFFIDPFVVKEGITFFWAKSSVGKSPVSWEMASSIGKGTSFFGLPSRVGRVLYIDVDTPENALAARIGKKPVAPNVWFYIAKPLGIPNIRKEVEDELKSLQKDIHPDVVFLNTLRKVHRLDDKDSATPVTVYEYFQHLYPQAALVFIHHTKKSPIDPRMKENKGENFSGSQHWINDAQVGLHLERYNDPRGRFNIRLYHKKSQISRRLRPVPLLLHQDGTTITCPLFEDMKTVYAMMNEREEKGGALDEVVAQELKISTATARRLRLPIELGQFPTSRHWLDPETGDEEGEEDGE